MSQEEDFRKQLERDIINDIKTKLMVKIKPLEDSIKEQIAKSLRNQKHYRSLSGGKLAEDFGFEKNKGTDFADSVIDSVKHALKVELDINENSINLFIRIYKADFSDALSSKLASYSSKGNKVDWLSWLLFSSGDVILKDYGVFKKNAPFKNSRSGNAIMLPIRGNIKRPFSVREDMRGSKDNNWITGAINESDPIIYGLIKTFGDSLGNAI